jgi:carbamoyl-phosphate synthase large subunit
VSKVLKVNFIELATKVMLGQHPEPVETDGKRLGYVGVKSAQFSFSRLQEADPLLGVDMASTGEVGCLGDDVYEALLKSVIAVGYDIPKRRILISSGNALQKADLLSACDMLAEHGYEILATGGSCDYLHANGIPAKRVLFPDESENPVMMSLCPSSTALIRSHEVDMVINIPKNFTDSELDNGYRIRRAAIDANVPLFTNARLATAFIKAFCTLSPDDLAIKAWDEYK